MSAERREVGVVRGTVVRFLSFVGALGLGGAAPGHDFWIQPSAFRVGTGELVGLSLMVGSEFPGDPVARDGERIVRFAAFGPSGETPVAGRDGMDPAGLARFTQPGVYTLAYESRPSPVTLDGARFNAYLKEKGLEKVAGAREAAGQSGAGAREVFSRCAKALVRVGKAPGGGFDRAVGLRLELTALDDPFLAGAGDSLRFRVDFAGKPCEGILVLARSSAAPGKEISARSGPDGTVALALPAAGMWMLTAVRMEAAPEESGAEWESVWASLSFEVGTARGAGEGR